MVFGVFSPGRTHCIAPKKLPDKAMSIWNLHKKFQLSSAMGLRDFDLQSQPTLMGGNPLIVVQWSPLPQEIRIIRPCQKVKYSGTEGKVHNFPVHTILV